MNSGTSALRFYIDKTVSISFYKKAYHSRQRSLFSQYIYTLITTKIVNVKYGQYIFLILLKKEK